MIHVASIDNLNTQREIFKRAEVIFCAKRFLELLPKEHKIKAKPLVPIDETIAYLKKNKNKESLIITSGDPLFFGIGRRLLKEFPKKILAFYPGITTVQRVCAHFKLPWDDMKIISLHGRQKDLKSEILSTILSKRGNFKIGIYTDSKNSPEDIANTLINLGFDKLRLLIAQDIGGKEEDFFELDIYEASKKHFHPLNFVILLGSNKGTYTNFGIKDDLFAHQKGLITKKEIRVNILSELRLVESRGVLWDIGAGSGSVSIEAALLNPYLDIFAIEKDKNRCLDIEKNIKKFFTPNVQVINKEAPQALFELPRPDRIFIGGGLGSSNLIDIAFNLLKDKGLLVASTILIDSLNKMLSFAKKNRVQFEAIQISSAKLRELGESFIISPSPPITIFTLWKK